MSLSRRNLLKGMLAGGALSTFGMPAWSTTVGTASRCVVLTANDPFADGARAAGPIARISVVDALPDVGRLQRLLDTLHGQRLIGLLRDDAYVLFAALARDAGLRQMFEGSHREAADPHGSRHVLQSSAGFHAAAVMLQASLAARRDWAHDTGLVLGRLAAGHAVPPSAGLRIVRLGTGPADASALRSHVSFVMQA